MTAIPVNVQPVTPELAVPYLTAAGFQAFPTWLDLDNLVPGGVAGMQTDELNDVLLTASQWCISVCENMPLHGHYVQGEQLRTRQSAGGRAYIKPRDIPVRAVTALSWGFDPTYMTADSLPDATMWFEDGREMSFVPGGQFTAFRGPALQFGPLARPSAQLYINWSYVAGYPSTALAAAVTQGASSLEVTDPTSILPGDTLRIYDVGKSEALTVASSYVPQVPTVPPAPTSIPLAAATQNAHAQTTGITGMPRGILQAVIAYAVALLMREDVSAEEPASGFGPAARSIAEGSGKAGGLINDALEFLAPYRPTFRS